MSDQSHQSNPYSNAQQSQHIESSYEQDNPNDDQFVDRDVPIQQDKDFFQLYGMFFCGVCKNMIQPLTTKGQLLQFKCKRCGNMLINFKNRQDKKCMLYSKALQQGSRKTVADPKFIFDQSMPRMTIDCPDCDYPEAVYVVTPDQGERKIVVRLICCRGAQYNTVECGNVWDLDQNAEIDIDTVKLVGTQKAISEFD